MQTTGALAHNWAGNITFGAARLHRPTSIDELRRIVAGAERAHVLGSGHSFNTIADTAGDLIRVDRLPRRVEIDRDRRTVTLSAGLRYGELTAELHAAGLALANLASLPHISVAGSVATGTHGSGNERRGLASAVRAMEFVGPDGETHTVDAEADPERFPGAVVHLGALGVVTALTLETEPTFEVAQWVYTGVPLDAVAAHYPEISASAYSVSVFTDWHSGEATVWLKRRTDREDAGRPGERWFGGTPAAGPWHPIPGMPATFCTRQGGVPGPWHERLPHFRSEFTPSGGEELQSELFLPRERAADAVAALREIAAEFAGVLQIAEIRTIAADELWLSPAQGRDSVALHFTWVKDQAAVLPVLAAVESRLLPLGARPHWGKLTRATPATVVELFPRFADFRRLAASLDPEGCFRNAFLDALFDAAPEAPSRPGAAAAGRRRMADHGRPPYPDDMDDQDILARVDELVSEERALREHGTGRGLGEDERLRLSDLEVRLDQCWDLLRQRRARAEFGDDPDGAAQRPAREVEGYQS